MGFSKISFRPTPIESDFLQKLFIQTGANNATQLMHVVMDLAMKQLPALQQHVVAGQIGLLPSTTTSVDMYGVAVPQKWSYPAPEGLSGGSPPFTNTMTAPDTYLVLSMTRSVYPPNAASHYQQPYPFSQSWPQFRPPAASSYSPAMPLLPPADAFVPSWLVQQVHYTSYLALFTENIARIKKAGA